MIEKYGLFDSLEIDRREYAEADFALLVKALRPDGVSGEEALKITAAEAGLRVKAAAGLAIVQGRYYALEEDGGSVLTLDLEAAAQYPRIDRIVLLLDFQKRTIKMSVLKGTENAMPVPPELTRDTAFYMLSLAQVYVDVGAALLSAEKITDERADGQLCGIHTKAIASVCKKRPDENGLVELNADDVGSVSKAAYEEKVRQIETELGKKHDVTKDGKPVTSINTRKPDAAGNMTVREGAKILTAKFLLDGWAPSSGKFEQTVTCTGMQAASNYSPPWIYKTGVENTDETLMEALGYLYAGVMTALDGQIKAVVPDKPTADIEVHLREAKA